MFTPGPPPGLIEATPIALAFGVLVSAFSLVVGTLFDVVAHLLLRGLKHPVHPERGEHPREQAACHEGEADEHERDPARDDRCGGGDDPEAGETAEHADDAGETESVQHSQGQCLDDLRTVKSAWQADSTSDSGSARHAGTWFGTHNEGLKELNRSLSKAVA